MNNYLAKRLFIIEKGSKNLSILPNDVKLILHVIDQLEIDFITAKNTSISIVENTINKFHIQYNLHFIRQQDFNKDTQKEIYDLFIEYRFPVMDGIDHPVLIGEWKKNLYATAYEKT